MGRFLLITTIILYDQIFFYMTIYMYMVYQRVKIDFIYIWANSKLSA